MKSTSHGHVDAAHQVGDEEHGALQHAHHEELAARVVARDLARRARPRGAGAPPPRRLSRPTRCTRQQSRGRRQRLQSTVRVARRQPRAGRWLECPAVDPEALRDRHARHPGDLAVGLDHRQRAPQRARHLAVAEQVLQRLRPVQPERLHPVAVAPRPHGERVARAGRRRAAARRASRGRRRAPADRAPRRPPTRRNGSCPGPPARPGPGGGVRPASVPKRTIPYSTVACSPPPRSTAPLPPALGEALDRAGILRAERRRGRRRPPPRAGAAPAGAARGRLGREAAASTAGGAPPGAGALQRLVHRLLEHLRLVAQLRQRSRARCRSAAGLISRSSGRTSRRSRFRARRRSALDSSSARRGRPPRSRRACRPVRRPAAGGRGGRGGAPCRAAPGGRARTTSR